MKYIAVALLFLMATNAFGNKAPTRTPSSTTNSMGTKISTYNNACKKLFGIEGGSIVATLTAITKANSSEKKYQFKMPTYFATGTTQNGHGYTLGDPNGDLSLNTPSEVKSVDLDALNEFLISKIGAEVQSIQKVGHTGFFQAITLDDVECFEEGSGCQLWAEIACK